MAHLGVSATDMQKRARRNEAYLRALTHSATICANKASQQLLMEFLNMTPVDMQGWMRKRSKYLHKWNKRYFAILGGELRWWADEPMSVWSVPPKMSCKLDSAIVSRVYESSVDGPSGHMLMIQRPIYTAQGQTDVDTAWVHPENARVCDDWLQAMMKGGMMKALRGRFLAPMVRDALSGAVADSLDDPNTEKEIAVYCSRLVFNMALLGIFAVW